MQHLLSCISDAILPLYRDIKYYFISLLFYLLVESLFLHLWVSFDVD